MSQSGSGRRIDGVEFHFLSEDEALSLVGEVAERDQEMILDIADAHGAPTYLIRGDLRDNVYRGTNANSAPMVLAKWVRIDGEFFGVWIEGEDEYLFRFSLSDSP